MYANVVDYFYVSIVIKWFKIGVMFDTISLCLVAFVTLLDLLDAVTHHVEV